VSIGNDLPFVFIGGPDSIESESHALRVGGAIREICQSLGIGYVFKASYDKANRTSIRAWRGVGLRKGMAVLQRVRQVLDVPVTTDVHDVAQARAVGAVVDLVQVPALLSRQTDLVVAAARYGRAVNIKKGQFIAPRDAERVIEKAASTGQANIMVTERGYMFGYNDVVADMRSLPLMARTGWPVIFDAAHTAQTPSSAGTASGGDRSLIPTLARAAVGAGAAGIFMEVHQSPERAKVDGPSSLRLDDLGEVLRLIRDVDAVVKRGDG
jgi:2-dehydro-3-deoxyphosphooctonate aldolase (KDO 8-P synthase)